MVGITVTQNTYNIWQTLLAFVLMFSAIVGGFVRLNKNLAKKDDIEKLQAQLAEVKDGNTKENTRIIAMIEDIKDDFQNDQKRLDRHIEFGGHRVQRNPLDGADE
jgi:hypothetical protein